MKKLKKKKSTQRLKLERIAKKLDKNLLTHQRYLFERKYSMMSNFEKWQKYTEGLSSPQNYIDWGWYYMISASLQRRVWIGWDENVIFANQYTILVGHPGVGKGILIRYVADILRHWKKEDIQPDVSKFAKTEEKELVQSIAESDLRRHQEQEMQAKNKQVEIVKPLAIPVAADATTYEALVEAVAKSFSRIEYKEHSQQHGKEILKVYGHSSLCFLLQELASLLRKRTHDTVNYLLGLYDCPLDYEYDTKTRGKDRVRKGCLNLLAGTTPSFMASTFDESLADEGFNSRVFYIYAVKNRKNQFFILKLTDEQLEFKKQILEHTKKLITLYGRVEVDDDTRLFLQNWWDSEERNKSQRANKSLKLVPYYARRNIHVMKVAMAIHFGESTEMFIPKETFKKAIDILTKEEKLMHMAIVMESENYQAKVAEKVKEFLGTGDKCVVDLLVETNPMIAPKGLEEVLTFLLDTDQIAMYQAEDETTQQNVTMYKIK